MCITSASRYSPSPSLLGEGVGGWGLVYQCSTVYWGATYGAEPGLQRVYSIIDLDHLRMNKRAAGRLQDLADLENLEDDSEERFR